MQAAGFSFLSLGWGSAIKMIFNKVGQWFIFQEDDLGAWNESMLFGLVEQLQK